MKENFIETQYDVTKKSRVKIFYEKNKKILFFALFSFVILIFSFFYYIESKANKIILLSDNYIEAKVQLEQGNKNVATKILQDVVYENHPTYSTLSFFLILNENLIKEDDEIRNMFDHLIKNNKIEKEVKNLLVFKKSLYLSNFSNESELIDVLKPLINKESLWKPHALLLLGDYFYSKKEFVKSKEFYMKILLLKNIDNEFYNEVNSRLALILND